MLELKHVNDRKDAINFETIGPFILEKIRRDLNRPQTVSFIRSRST